MKRRPTNLTALLVAQDLAKLALATIWVQVLNARKANAELELLRRQLEE